MTAQTATTIHPLCDALADAFERKGVAVRANLSPGLAREEILRIVEPLGIALPEDVIALYEWRNGHLDEFSEDVIRFRDNTFISLERAVEEHAQLMSIYALDSTLEEDRVDLQAALPISFFEGSCDVVACGAHLHHDAGDHPVIRVFEGIDMYYPSIESMLRICTEWVSHPDWDAADGFPGDAEMEIWQKHVPGIFGG